MLLPIVMPKWGLAMQEGLLTRWSVAEGETIALGQELAEIETTKIANTFESPVSGTVRRIVAQSGETLPVGALLAVVSEGTAEDAEIDGFVAKFQASFVSEEKVEAAPEPEFIDTAAGRLRFLRLGTASGQPLLLLHGFGSDLTSWMFNHAALAETRPVYAVDLPGHGGSTKTVTDGSVAGLAGAVLAFMDAAKLTQAHLVGHSLGAAVAAHLVATHPDRVAGLALIAPAGLGPEISGRFIDGFIAETRARKLRGVLEMLVADPGLITAEMVEEVLKYKRLDGAVEALKAIAAANFSGDRQIHLLRDALQGTKIPVQVIVGAEDRVIPAAQAEGLSIPVLRIPGAGHLPHMEKSAEVNAALAS